MKDTILSLISQGLNSYYSSRDFPDSKKKVVPIESAKASMTFFNPNIFNNLRQNMGVSIETFRRSLCDKKLVSISNPGKSVAMFIRSNNGLYLLKTITAHESKFLTNVSPKMMEHTGREKSFLTHIFDHFKIKFNGTSVRMIIMNNLLACYKYDQIYDLKGSMKGRKTKVPTKNISKTPVFKDKNFLEDHKSGLRIDKESLNRITSILESDYKFLRDNNVIDHSFLMALINLESLNTGDNTRIVMPFQSSEKSKNNGDKPMVDELVVLEPKSGTPEEQIKTVYIPPGGFLVTGPGDASSTPSKCYIVYFQIIDILIEYKLVKKIESAVNAINECFDRKKRSVVPPPRFYARFMKFFARQILLSTDSSKDSKWLSKNKDICSKFNSKCHTSLQPLYDLLPGEKKPDADK
ncbi:MAG: Phosphatidylinositol 4-phosphate 5-kinase type-1 gamma [Marteilia pararefringens]